MLVNLNCNVTSSFRFICDRKPLEISYR